MGEILAGKYQITGFLGEGGMGTVWRARSLLLDVDVAIKVLHREHADGDASARLLREARATASLGHSAIVRVLDFGETDAGEPFLVMELLEGISLADWIDGNGRMSADQAVRTLLPIADALVVAHAHGVVHRDVKPDNILLAGGELGNHLPKILDFGIAKLLTTQSGRVLTQAGAVLGSLEYMSPEQAEGKLEVGQQTDVWGLSVVLYELVTGRRPFAGATLTAMLFSLLTKHPTPTHELAAGDEELWKIIARGLEKSPAERWPDMRAFGTALARWAVERGVSTDVTNVSLAVHWLATPSQPPDGRASAAPISAAPPGAGPPVLARLGTIETTYVAPVTPPARRTRAIRAAMVAALLMVPALAAVELFAPRGGRDVMPGASETGAVALASLPVVLERAPATILPDVASAPILPGAAPAPSASASAAVGASHAGPPRITPPPRRAAPAGRATSTGMPLPPAPNF
jgi:serine/threonine-protein kinase